MSDNRKPVENFLDAIRDCTEITEQMIPGTKTPVFDVKFNREKARQLLQDYVALLNVGRAG